MPHLSKPYTPKQLVCVVCLSPSLLVFLLQSKEGQTEESVSLSLFCDNDASNCSVLSDTRYILAQNSRREKVYFFLFFKSRFVLRLRLRRVTQQSREMKKEKKQNHQEEEHQKDDDERKEEEEEEQSMWFEEKLNEIRGFSEEELNACVKVLQNVTPAKKTAKYDEKTLEEEKEEEEEEEEGERKPREGTESADTFTEKKSFKTVLELKQHKRLRTSLLPLVEYFTAKLYRGQDPKEYRERTQSKRAKNDRNQRMRAMDRDAVAKTKLREERLRKLRRLEETNFNNDAASEEAEVLEWKRETDDAGKRALGNGTDDGGACAEEEEEKEKKQKQLKSSMLVPDGVVEEEDVREHHGRRRKTSDRAEYATQSKRVLLLQKTFHRSAPFLRLHVSILRGGKLFSATFYVRHERKILHSHRSES